MSKRLTILLLIFIPLYSIPVRAFAEQYVERWTVGYSQGIAEYIVENGNENQFNINCNETADGMVSGIMIRISGKSAPPKSNVVIVLDGNDYKFYTDDFGGINTDCHDCADTFISLWKKLKSARTMHVQMSDGRSSEFSMKNASKVFKRAKCLVEYYHKKF